MTWPKIPIGSKRLRDWADTKLKAYIDSGRPVSGLGSMIHQGPQGTAINVVSSTASSGNGLPPTPDNPGAYVLAVTVSESGAKSPVFWMQLGNCSS